MLVKWRSWAHVVFIIYTIMGLSKWWISAYPCLWTTEFPRKAPFTPNHETIACSQWTCVVWNVFGGLTTSSVFCCSCANLFEKCCRHRTMNRMIFRKITEADEVFVLFSWAHVKMDSQIITFCLFYALHSIPTAFGIWVRKVLERIWIWFWQKSPTQRGFPVHQLIAHLSTTLNVVTNELYTSKLFWQRARDEVNSVSDF